jgi:hypothetical protein
MILVKISLGVFFLRILVERWQRTVVYIFVTLSSVVGFGYFWYAVFQCGVPGDSYWQKLLTHQCKGANSRLVLGVSDLHASVNALTDIVLVSIPIPVVIRSKISLREKLVVGGIFAMAVM